MSDTSPATFEIKHRFTGEVRFSCELSAEVAGQSYGFKLGFAIKKAVAARANLTRANLTDANLIGAFLTGANLTDANLTRANLTRANLTDADLTEANLTRANLTDANLIGAFLTGANLTDANLTGTDLARADLTRAKQDFLAEVLRLPNELDALRAALVEGRVDGSTYTGECACLAGTLANAAGVQDYRGADFQAAVGITFHASSSSPRERFFLAIGKGDTPETNPASAIALAWTDEAIAIRDMIRATAKDAV